MVSQGLLHSETPPRRARQAELASAHAAPASEIGHIRLADDADVVGRGPATADVIARLAAGMADDLLAAVVLATRAPVLLAPAMNVNMWENPLTQDNLAGWAPGPAPGASPRWVRTRRAGLRLDRRRPPGRAGGDRGRGRAASVPPRSGPRWAGRGTRVS